MDCNNCGKQIDDNAVVCIHCGVAIKPVHGVSASGEDGPLGCLLGGVCFLFPIAGLIMYLVWKDSKPSKCKEAGKWGLIGFGVGIAIYVLYFIIIGVTASSYYY